jgi:hypothetical protein
MKFLLLELKRVWGMKKKISKVHWELDAEALAQLRGCKETTKYPYPFVVV